MCIICETITDARTSLVC